MEIVLILGIVATLLSMILQPYFESKTYNKLTGAETTWWDAVWVELRIENSTEN